jgi:ubiquinone/menaquinone biosynthesis C-methylase UbiE
LEQAHLRAGEYVLDLGCGGGREAVLAAAQVGPDGHVFGLDMTSEMLELARRTAKEAAVDNISFLQGFIENIPLPDCAVDVVISNCVINLSDDRPQVLREACRVLRAGGRFIVADIVLCESTLPDAQRRATAPLLGCVNGVLTVGEYKALMVEAGFADVSVSVYRHYTAETLEARAKAREQQELWDRIDPACVDNAFGAAFIKARL